MCVCVCVCVCVYIYVSMSNHPAYRRKTHRKRASEGNTERERQENTLFPAGCGGARWLRHKHAGINRNKEHGEPRGQEGLTAAHRQALFITLMHLSQPENTSRSPTSTTQHTDTHTQLPPRNTPTHTHNFHHTTHRHTHTASTTQHTDTHIHTHTASTTQHTDTHTHTHRERDTGCN